MNGSLDIRLLQTFQTVAKTLNFTRAAEELDYAQSSVTVQIQALEKSLGVKLFKRLGKHTVLTDSGKRLLEYADRILKLTDEAYLAVIHHDEPIGKLYISAPETLSAYRLPPLLREFHKKFPGVQLILQYTPTDKVFERLGNGDLDIAFILDEQRISSGEILVRPLVQEPLFLLASPDHPFAALPMITSEDLRTESLLLTEAGCTYRLLFEKHLLADDVRLATTMEFSSVDAIKQCVIAGIGITYLPEIAVERELEQGTLMILNWTAPEVHFYTQILWHQDQWMAPAQREFIRLSEQVLTALPDNSLA